MEHYEQLEFPETERLRKGFDQRVFQNFSDQVADCNAHNCAKVFDYNGRLIKLGDFVRPVFKLSHSYSEKGFKKVKGYVTKIVEDDFGSYIEISSISNKVLIACAYPYNYVVV